MLLLAGCLLGGCERGQPLPEAAPEAGLLPPSGGTVTLGPVSLQLPEGALDEATVVRIDAAGPCPAGPGPDVYLFRCPYMIAPEQLQFKRPVVLTVTEYRYWLRAVNEQGIDQSYPAEKLSLFEIDASTGKATQVPGVQLQLLDNQVRLTAPITHTGRYQIGVPGEFIQFSGGWMEARLTGDIDTTIALRNYASASGGAVRQTEHLGNRYTTTLFVLDNPDDPVASAKISILTTATAAGTFPFTNANGENASVISYYRNGEQITVNPFLGEAGQIRFDRYDPPGGLVTGSYQTQGGASPGEKRVNITIRFGLRRLL
jgi:hypothetical protein